MDVFDLGGVWVRLDAIDGIFKSEESSFRPGSDAFPRKGFFGVVLFRGGGTLHTPSRQDADARDKDLAKLVSAWQERLTKGTTRPG